MRVPSRSLALFSLLAGCQSSEAPAPSGTPGEVRRADLTLTPNTVSGTFKFTNMNAAFLTLLNDQKMISYLVNAVTAKGDLSASTPLIATANPLGFSYTLSVPAQTMPGDMTGVHYKFGLSGYFDRRVAGRDLATGQVVIASLPDLFVPFPTGMGGVTQNFNTCMGALRLRFRTMGPMDCSMPKADPVSSGAFGYASQSYMLGGANEYYLILPDGTNFKDNILWSTGKSAAYDPNNLGMSPGDLINFVQAENYTAKCDVIQDLCLTLADVGTLGTVTEPLSIDGVGSIQAATLLANGGSVTEGALRTNRRSPGEAPVADPTMWYKLPNLPPGGYPLGMSGTFGTGQAAFTYFNMAVSNLTVDPKQPQPQSFPKGGAYPFVTNPAHWTGSLTLRDDFNELSTLAVPAFKMDGTVDDLFASVSYISVGGAGTISRQALPGTFDAGTHMLKATYDERVPLPYNEPVAISQLPGTGALGLFFATPDHPGGTDTAFRKGSLTLNRDHTPQTLGPGQSFTLDHEYCMSRVHVAYHLGSDFLVNPTAQATGAFHGTDGFGNKNDYEAVGAFSGIPYATDQSMWPKLKSTDGTVTFALPEGAYQLTPGATVINEFGTGSVASFPQIPLTLGCAQDVTVASGVSVSLSNLPACVADPKVAISGTVNAMGRLAKVYYTVNGGAEVDICNGTCGASPYMYTANVDLTADKSACDFDIRVYAVPVDANTPAFAEQRLRYNDPNDGILCAQTCNTETVPITSCGASACPGPDGGTDSGPGLPDGGGADGGPRFIGGCSATATGGGPVSGAAGLGLSLCLLLMRRRRPARARRSTDSY